MPELLPETYRQGQPKARTPIAYPAELQTVQYPYKLEYTPLSKIQVKENERAVLIDVYMPSIRMANINRSVNRTVTLPAWLNAAALERNINFSQVLQDALKAQLHIG